MIEHENDTPDPDFERGAPEGEWIAPSAKVRLPEDVAKLRKRHRRAVTGEQSKRGEA